jgi:hypothetical protein
MITAADVHWVQFELSGLRRDLAAATTPESKAEIMAAMKDMEIIYRAK